MDRPWRRNGGRGARFFSGVWSGNAGLWYGWGEMPNYTQILYFERQIMPKWAGSVQNVVPESKSWSYQDQYFVKPEWKWGYVWIRLYQCDVQDPKFTVEMGVTWIYDDFGLEIWVVCGGIGVMNVVRG